MPNHSVSYYDSKIVIAKIPAIPPPKHNQVGLNDISFILSNFAFGIYVYTSKIDLAINFHLHLLHNESFSFYLKMSFS